MIEVCRMFTVKSKLLRRVAKITSVREMLNYF